MSLLVVVVLELALMLVVQGVLVVTLQIPTIQLDRIQFQ
tara:strand:+ start:807 stop:923 length:117 start_codon:yes stop_codon:yes gene_type:complete